MKNDADFFGVDDTIYEQHKVLVSWFPRLAGWMNEIADKRTSCKYSMANLLCEGMFLFMSKELSRNSANNKAEHGRFYTENFSRLFEGMQWAHLDTANDLYKSITLEEVEEVKTKMVRDMIEKKRITTFRGYYLIAIDGTGVTSYDKNIFEGNNLLYKKSKNGKVTYLNIMLEAKIITPDGMSISIASEPLSNAEMSAYQKQDCELNAFKRIAAKIKKQFPRLPVCLLLDGLYTKEPMFGICEKYNWKYIAVLKDGSLKRLQEAVTDTEESSRQRFTHTVSIKQGKETVYADSKYQCIEGLHHKSYEVNWIEAICPKPRKKQGEDIQTNRFVYLTNLSLNHKRGRSKQILIRRIAEVGRLRWKIENEGFNTQKNHGYHLHHKFSRKSIKALHVYYILMQMAHIVNQIVEHSTPVADLRKRHPKLTVRYLWERLRQVLEDYLLDRDLLNLNKKRCQIRLVHSASRLE